ncbi:hypothetical protein SEA_WAWA_55 [Arthrobacter phage Wawa]|uniref:Uncharacterized protein n=3 Tax=Korravirus TaxID=1982076 RepID=A0A3S9U9Y7_9CAUD|nr:hypothetical protein KDJ08_gp55 [Arthrobacter phage Wawa]AZS07098.1 hypothetical protein SEA_CHOLULA_54 [Arthrobacter phage Cholula]AZS11161.1 hypothetical protein SEA_WAWA_55 [Arthrobacter phage Wawa]AZS11877.1 hypothetical protein SEA_POTATOES_54 [Arthrobacter phage Potatoes]
MTENTTPKAQDTINAIFGTKGNPPKAVTTRKCTCGCGEATSSAKTMYKPGHDARHAGNVARAIAEAVLNGTEAKSSLTDLPTANLVHKADAMSKRLVEKARTKADRAAGRKTSDKPAKPAGKIAEVVAAEEAAHAEETATEVPEPMFEDENPVYRERGFVKIGRWEYPLRENHFGKTERNTKRDGSGEWVEYEAN